MSRRIVAMLIVLLVSVTGCASQHLRLSCQVDVPKQYQQDSPGWISPTAEPESVRYTKGYEAFWWNCVMVKADDLDAWCPFACSGTAGASDGCNEGAEDAERQTRQRIARYTIPQVKDYLRSIAKDPEGRSKARAYFPDGPARLIVSENDDSATLVVRPWPN